MEVKDHFWCGKYFTFVLFLGESSAGSIQTDPSLLAVFYDYIKLMPMVAEVNQMSQELKKVTQSHILSFRLTYIDVSVECLFFS